MGDLTMDFIRIPTGGWVLVCDGAKALILRNDGTVDALHLVPVDIAVQDLPAAHEMGTERPGRVHQSQGDARSSNEIEDLHQAGELAFLIRTAATLDAMVRDHVVKSLVVVAPAQALGVLRGHFTPAVTALVTAELGRDLARLSTREIETHLAA
jgi:protein required for attachment to host cells